MAFQYGFNVKFFELLTVVSGPSVPAGHFQVCTTTKNGGGFNVLLDGDVKHNDNGEDEKLV